MITELYKKSKRELFDICKKNKIEYKERETKRQIADKIYQNMKGGREYICTNSEGRQNVINSYLNPVYGEGRYSLPGWICQESNLAQGRQQSGCSDYLKPNMECVSCLGKKNQVKPKECDNCISGTAYYCESPKFGGKKSNKSSNSN